MAKKKKSTRIKENLEELKKTFKNLPSNKWSLMYPLMERASFCKATLEDIEDAINNGDEKVVSEYQNGANQKGDKPSGAVTTYNTLLKNYNTVLKTLASFLPNESSESKLDQFLNDD